MIMTNRALIRNKILQIAFSSFIDDTKRVEVAESEYRYSMQKSYDLYVMLLLLMIKVTDEQADKAERLKTRYVNPVEATAEELRFINNRFIASLRENNQLESYLSKHSEINDVLTPALVKSTLDKILKSELYEKYTQISDDNYDEDKSFWRRVVNTWVYDTEIDESLEESSLYWNNDIDIIITFVIKTIKSFTEASTEDHPIINSFDPELVENADDEFPAGLLRYTIQNFKPSMAQISECITNWESDRIANMDFVIMSMALTEAKLYPSIPLNVTLSEYIELAKSYSTVKSANFINGVLDTLLKKIKK